MKFEICLCNQPWSLVDLFVVFCKEGIYLWSFPPDLVFYEPSLWGEVYYHWGWGIIEVYYHWISSIYDPQDVPAEAVSNKLFRMFIFFINNTHNSCQQSHSKSVSLLSLAWMNDEGNWKQRVLKIRSGALNCSQRKDQSVMEPFENSKLVRNCARRSAKTTFNLISSF